MNKVLIVSDSHGLTKELVEIKKRYEDIPLIHCGDSELHPNSEELKGFIKVGGNCDFHPDFLEEQIITIEGLTFLVTHGHLHHVKMNLMKLFYRAQEVGANIVCFGHSLIAGTEKIDQQLFVNPGSIRLPRNRPEKTYAIVSWKTSDHIQVNYYTIDGIEVKSLYYQSH